MTRIQFKQIVSKSIKERALEYLLERRRKKGSKIIYTSIQMSDYMLPNDYITNIDDIRTLFSLKNEMFLNKKQIVKNEPVCECGTG